jgi:hypothetical protein
MSDSAAEHRKLGIAWVLLCLSLALHVADEATTGFLSIYNPTVLSLRASLGWWPMPTYAYQDWLTGLIVVCLALLALSPFMFAGVRWMHGPAYFLAALMMLNAIGHTWFSIVGRTVPEVTFSRPAPGFWSSPFLAAASIYMFLQLRRTAHKPSP